MTTPKYYNGSEWAYVSAGPEGPTAISTDAGQQATLGTDSLILVSGLAEQADVDAVHAATGEPTGIASASAVTLSFDNATRVVTVAPTSGSYDYWYFGTKVSVGASKTVTVTDVTGTYFVYFDDTSGTLRISTTPWNLATTVQVAAVYWDATQSKGLLLDERHGITMDSATHLRLHSVSGTQVVSGFAASNYTLNSDTDANITPDIASGVIADEDIRFTTTLLTAGTGVYKVFYRSGVAGEWTWADSDYPLTYATYPHWNQLTGGSWTRTALAAANNWVNYYAVAVPSLTSGFSIIWVMGQAVYTSLVAATAENPANLSWGALPFQEMAILYRVTFRSGSGYGSTPKARIESFTRMVGSTVSINATGVNTHSALAGLTDANAHPASSISVDTGNFTGNLSAADGTVQAALNTLDDMSVSGLSPFLLMGA